MKELTSTFNLLIKLTAGSPWVLQVLPGHKISVYEAALD